VSTVVLYHIAPTHEHGANWNSEQKSPSKMVIKIMTQE
jgi:hypothetical protein